MILTIKDLSSAMNSYQKINKEKFSLKTAYKLTRLFQDIEKEVECYEKVVKNTLIKYSEKDENGEPIIHQTEQGDSVQLSPENQIICINEINELGNSEVEIKDCQIYLDEFGDISVSIEELKGLMPFIKEE